MTVNHLRGTLLPEGDVLADIWVVDGRISFQPVDGAEEIGPRGGFILPGLVDCHVHLTMDFAGYGLEPGSPEIVARGREDHLRSGTLLLRDVGTLNMAATIGLPAGDDLPLVHAAGNLLAPPGRYFGIERPATADQVAGIAAEQVKAGARWVKLIGDWCIEGTDFSRTEKNYPDDAVRAVVERVHAAGARVAVHTTSHEAIAQAVAAGVDSIEHGFWMDEGLLKQMAAQGTAWTPTLFIEPAVMQMVGEAGPESVRKMREGFEATRAAAARAPSLGVRVLAGTDMAPPGNVWREVAVLYKLGMAPNDALASATTWAREFLGEPALDEGAPADLVVYKNDPRNDPEVLSRPALVMFRGRIVRM
jgi:imidazolonepropionase-like amidohydrolase